MAKRKSGDLLGGRAFKEATKGLSSRERKAAIKERQQHRQAANYGAAGRGIKRSDHPVGSRKGKAKNT